jgi:alpha-1,6-mannosyltransferase
MSGDFGRFMNHRASAVGLLVGAGVVLNAACWELSRVENLVAAPRAFLVLFTVAFVAYAAGATASARLSGPGPVGVVLAVGITCRLILLPTAPSLSTDAYRYVWDARVASAGVDPYVLPPTAPELAGLRDADIYSRLNHTTWRTVYPPVAEAVFRAVYRIAPDSVLAMKIALGLAELAGLAGLVLWLRTLGLPLGRLTIYAWNPLVLVEIWGSGHVDAIVLLTIVAAGLASARGRDGLAAICLGLGTLVKLYPAVLLLLLPGLRRPGILALFAAVILAGTLVPGGPGRWPVGSIGRYVADEYFNPGLVRSFVNEPVLALTATVAWVLVVAALKGARSMATQAVPMVAGVIVLAPNVFPWYAVWLVPFLTTMPSVPWIAFTGTVVFSYAFFLSDPWAIPWWARLVEVAPLAVGAVVMLLRATPAGERLFRVLRRHPGASSTTDVR